MKRILATGMLLLQLSASYGQELNCNVQVVSQQIQGTNRQVFQTMQTELFEFMNNRVWTNHVFTTEERIECTLMFNITEQLSADEFKGTLQIQSRRPVFSSNYNTVMLNYVDNDIQFKYIEFESLEFEMNTYTSNLTSILAFYAYVILALDYDSFGLEGGSPFWQAAEKIVDNAQNARETGWKPYESTSHKNRYWLVKDFLDPAYAPCRDFIYRYHRLGLDMMDAKINEGRSEITASIENLQTVFRKKPDPFLQPLQIIFDAKADEMVYIFSESFTEEKNRSYQILVEINQANSNKYKKILEPPSN